MARDYKHRAQGGNKAPRRQSLDQPQSVGLWKWMLVTALIISFVVFLVYLRSTGSKQIKPQQTSQVIPIKPEAIKNHVLSPVEGEAPKQEKKPEPESPKPIAAAKPVPAPEPVLPQFDFYTILPEKEVVVQDYEINTRTREERVGQAKKASYNMQAGSFKEFKDADSLRAKLALMGIESRVEKAKVGNVTWNRVKMGPYDRMTSVSSIRARLRQNGIDVIVTEAGR
jgi:cell division septation protein DedD